MSLPDNERRCIGIGTEQGEPDTECLSCERRTQGIADIKAGRRRWWMPVPTVLPCEERLTP